MNAVIFGVDLSSMNANFFQISFKAEFGAKQYTAKAKHWAVQLYWYIYCQQVVKQWSVVNKGLKMCNNNINHCS